MLENLKIYNAKSLFNFDSKTFISLLIISVMLDLPNYRLMANKFVYYKNLSEFFIF